jgi:hypothetical protein
VLRDEHAAHLLEVRRWKWAFFFENVMGVLGYPNQLIDPLLRTPSVCFIPAFADVVGKLHTLGGSNALAYENAALGLFDVVHVFESGCI